MSAILTVFTSEPTAHLVATGLSRAWKISRRRAARANEVVFIRKRPGASDHRTAYLRATIIGIDPDPQEPGRCIIRFTDPQPMNVAGVFRGARNPVRYATSNDVGLAP